MSSVFIFLMALSLSSTKIYAQLHLSPFIKSLSAYHPLHPSLKSLFSPYQPIQSVLLISLLFPKVCFALYWPAIPDCKVSRVFFSLISPDFVILFTADYALSFNLFLLCFPVTAISGLSFHFRPVKFCSFCLLTQHTFSTVCPEPLSAHCTWSHSFSSCSCDFQNVISEQELCPKVQEPGSVLELNEWSLCLLPVVCIILNSNIPRTSVVCPASLPRVCFLSTDALSFFTWWISTHPSATSSLGHLTPLVLLPFALCACRPDLAYNYSLSVFSHGPQMFLPHREGASERFQSALHTWKFVAVPHTLDSW